MVNFIAIQNTANFLELALFNDVTLQESVQLSKIEASANLIPMLHDLLKRHSLSLSDLSCIVVNKGPAPFTTLRTVIATVNGLHFERGLPLVGLNGLSMLIEEYHDPSYDYTVALMNAFNNDLYYAIYDTHTKTIRMGCNKVVKFLNEFSLQNKKILCIGNGALLFKDVLEQHFGASYLTLHPQIESCSLSYLAQQGLRVWQQKPEVGFITPVYLK